MRTMRLIAAVLTLASAPLVLAQGFASTGPQLAPIGWAATGSGYAAAAKGVEHEFFNRTDDAARFLPEELSRAIDSNLEKRLEARLEQELTAKGAEAGRSVSVN